MTIPRLSPSASAVVAVATASRDEDIADAKEDYSTALASASQRWVSRVKPLVDSKQITVDQVAATANMGRQRVYQLFRLHAPATTNYYYAEDLEPS